MLPLRIAVDLLQPSPPIESSLHLMLIPFVQIRHRSMDLACHPGLGPLLKTVRVQGTTTAVIFVTVAVRKNPIWNDSFLATPSHSRRPRSRGSPSPKRLEFSRESHSQDQMRFASRRSPSQHQMRFASRGSPSPGEWDSHQGGHPLQSEWDSHQEGHPLQSEWDSLLPLRSEWDSLQGSPLLNSGWNSHQEGHPLQSEWDSHQEGHPLQANGTRIKWVTLSKVNGIRF